MIKFRSNYEIESTTHQRTYVDEYLFKPIFIARQTKRSWFGCKYACWYNTYDSVDDAIKAVKTHNFKNNGHPVINLTLAL